MRRARWTAAAVALNAQNRHRFEDLERLLAQWAEKGLFRADAAEAYLQRQRALQAEMIGLLRFGRFGQDAGACRHRPVRGLEGALFPGDAAFGGGAVRAARARRWAAIDKLLAAWEKEGVATPDQARARRERAAGKKGFDNPAPAL